MPDTIGWSLPGETVVLGPLKLTVRIPTVAAHCARTPDGFGQEYSSHLGERQVDKLLPNWACPKCNKGMLALIVENAFQKPSRNIDAPSTLVSKGLAVLTSIFQACRGPEALSPQTHSAVLLLLFLRVSHNAIHLILGVGHKSHGADAENFRLLHKHVLAKEKGITLGLL